MTSALALLRQLRSAETDPGCPPTDYAGIYLDLSVGVGTAEDLAAFTWAERHGHPDVIPTLAQLERRCEQLVRDGADASTYHNAVRRLVSYIATIRNAYQDAGVA